MSALNLDGTCLVPVHGSRSAVIDIDDLERVSALKWYAHKNGGGLVYVRSGTPPFVLMHRFILDAPRGVSVDHINRDTFDNRKANLRLCTAIQQRANTGPRKGRQFKGAFFHKGRWFARIRIGGDARYLGRYDTAEEAARAYDEVALAVFGQYACLNFPRSGEAA